MGTCFFKAPQILEAQKDNSVNKKLKLFTKALDVYSYGMTCYEILTRKFSFDGHLFHDHNLVINGGRLEIPEYVDNWVLGLLNECWHSNSEARPSFGELLNLISAISIHIRKLVNNGKIFLYKLEWIKWEI